MAELTYDDVIEVYKEALWSLANIINCGSEYHGKHTWELSTLEEYSDPENGVIAQRQTNKMMKGFIRGIKILHDSSLVLNILDAIERLLKIDDVYELSVCFGENPQDGVYSQFGEHNGLEAL